MSGISTKALNFGKENKKGYAGNEIQNKEFGDGSGLELYDFNARTYDQQIGRFIQIDPMTDEGSQESWSPYHYSYNNPVTYSDPDGEFPIPIIWAIVAALTSEAAVTTTVVATAATLTTAAVYDAAANASTEPIGKSIQGEGTYIVGSSFTMGASSSNRITSSTQTVETAQTASSSGSGASSAKSLAKNTGGAGSKVGAAVAKQTGSYTTTHKSGKTYSGKGSESRAKESANRVGNENSDPAKKTEWKPSKNTREAFKTEDNRIQKNGGAGNTKKNYNKINSPGKKYNQQDKQ